MAAAAKICDSCCVRGKRFILTTSRYNLDPWGHCTCEWCRSPYSIGIPSTLNYSRKKLLIFPYLLWVIVPYLVWQSGHTVWRCHSLQPEWDFFYTRLRHTKLIVLKYHYSEFTEAKDDGGGGDNWSCKMCKAPVIPTLTNQQQAFYWLEAFPVAHPTVSKQWRQHPVLQYDILYAQHRNR